MTPVEFFQSAYDCAPVLEASIDDLNAQTLQKVLCRQRQAHPRIFGQMTDSEMLSKLGILKEVEGKRHPTLAALLAFGTYPQQFFPKLCVTITQYAGIDKSTMTEDKPNVFSKTLCGPISDLLYNSVKLLVELTKIGDRQASFFSGDRAC